MIAIGIWVWWRESKTWQNQALQVSNAAKLSWVEVPWRPEVFNSPRQILTLLDKVSGYGLQGKYDLADKPRNLQIFPNWKFGINRTTGIKVMAKTFGLATNELFSHNFLAGAHYMQKICVQTCIMTL